MDDNGWLADEEPVRDLCEGRTMQPISIHWLNQYDLSGALQQSSESGKSVLLNFYDATCSGCVSLEQDTYSDPAVITMVAQHVIPLRVVTTEPDRSTAEIINCYISISTPTVQLLSREGTACHYWRGAPRQTVLSARQITQGSRRVYMEAQGCLPPTLFCAQLLIGRGKVALNYECFEAALRLFDEALVKYGNDAEIASEARYWISRVAPKAYAARAARC